MTTPSPEDILFLRGRLCVNPNDLNAAWPHGGTDLGLFEAAALEIADEPFNVWAQEWAAICDQVEQGAQWILGFTFRTQDEDLLGLAFRSASAGAATGLRHVKWAPGTQRPGALRSARAVSLLFAPLNPAHHRAIYFRCALPGLAAQKAMVDLDLAKEAKLPLVFVAVPASGGAAAEWAMIKDLTL